MRLWRSDAVHLCVFFFFLFSSFLFCALCLFLMYAALSLWFCPPLLLFLSYAHMTMRIYIAKHTGTPFSHSCEQTFSIHVHSSCQTKPYNFIHSNRIFYIHFFPNNQNDTVLNYIFLSFQFSLFIGVCAFCAKYPQIQCWQPERVWSHCAQHVKRAFRDSYFSHPNRMNSKHNFCSSHHDQTHIGDKRQKQNAFQSLFTSLSFNDVSFHLFIHF